MTKKYGLNLILKEKFVWIIVICILMIGIVIGVSTTVGSIIFINETSTNEFCSSCHSHKPIVASFKADIHGGINKFGVVAKCVDCHLPNDNMTHYLTVKTLSGTNDIYIEFFGNPEAVDWLKKRDERETFVYDSGCLKCHTNLRKATENNLKASSAHMFYFEGQYNLKCVTCHKHVGHKSLETFLKKDKATVK